jgi:uncharacterized membrane protein
MEQKEKNLELDRLVFFSDAIVAIAITLLALDLRAVKTGSELTYADIFHSWHKFVAFFLSFIIIATFWKIHHQFYFYIKKIDEKLLFFNIGWLLLITIIPFTTNLLSDNLTNVPAVSIYCANIFLLSIFQNLIWDYACEQLIIFPGKRGKIVGNVGSLLKDNTSKATIREYRLACNIAMINALFALVLSFFVPVLAVIILFSRILFFRRSAVQWMNKTFEKRQKQREKNRINQN